MKKADGGHQLHPMVGDRFILLVEAAACRSRGTPVGWRGVEKLEADVAHFKAALERGVL